MAQIQPPNTQTLRPQHLTQVGHEGNPVECSIEVTGSLDSPNPFDADGDDLGGPILYPAVGAGGPGGSESSPIGELTIGGGTMDCVGAASVTLTVTGGAAPYTWSTTVGVLSSSTGSSVALTPPVNSGSGLPGIAYSYTSKYVKPFCTTDCFRARYACDGSFIDCTGAGGNACMATLGGSCSGFVTDPTNIPGPVYRSSAAHCTTLPVYTDGCAGVLATKQCLLDERSGAQISGGCAPCVIVFADGAIVTVTDAQGHQAFFGVELE